MVTPMPDPRLGADVVAYWEAEYADIGGQVPVNTHGGMLSHPHAGAARGMFGLIEVVAQLRGGLGTGQVENEEAALVHKEGDVLFSHCTVIPRSDRNSR